MRKGKHKLQVPYIPMPSKNRFWGLYSENCYTEDELNLREQVKKARAESKIHQDYLTNPSSWFAENSQALINPYENSWFLSNTFKPRHTLTRDDFHVQPIDSQRLQWPALYDLMQKTGDYLLLRNQHLSPDHLNQPMNFILLDINFMLKGLSQNTDINQVKEQLELITKYLRSIEKNISPLVGSDRLFLANFRRIIDDNIHPQLTNKIESQLLRDRLNELSKTIKKLSTDRNRILHFALNINPVNPHPYDFSIDLPDDSTAYPTQSAKNCGQGSTQLTAEPLSILKLTMAELKDCPNFKLISMSDEILEHYAEAITDLNELGRFQKVVNQIMDLLGQAGEVYTIHQFKSQMVTLLKQIDLFIDQSSKPIEAIIHANTQSYHQAIQDEQNLSLWKQWFSSEKEKLKTYINNQDTLAQFPSTTSDLAKTNKALKGHVNQVISHLDQPKTIETTFEAIAEQAQELNKIMGSMHLWIKIQYEKQGLEPPKPPEPLKLISTPHSEKIKEIKIDFSQSEPKPIYFGPQLTPFFSQKSENNTPYILNRSEHTEQKNTLNTSLLLGTIFLIPIGILSLYYLSNQRKNEKGIENEMNKLENTEEQLEIETKKTFDTLITEVEDLIININLVPSKDDLLIETFEDAIYTYTRLKNKAKRKIYLIETLKDVHEDFKFIYNEISQHTTNCSL